MKRGRFLNALSKELSNITRDYWELLATAQHYGFKTMLLDFSYSLQVAAFFATYNPPKNSIHGCIMIISKTDFQSLGIGELKIIDSPINNERLSRQEGCFVTRFNPNFLGERGLFEAPCFLHTSDTQIYRKDNQLTYDNLFPDERNDPINKIATQYL